MPRCKIFLFTYKRNDLLPRAVQHLVHQTFTDWTCEVHNDSPGNAFPSEYIKSLNDPRFVVINHETNFGGTVSFNLAFGECSQDYVSILEDDNWWEPEFLQEMTSFLDRNPKTDIVWSNMRIWRETVNSEWENTQKTIWPLGSDNEKFTFPNDKQALGALHSTGAMMFRGRNAKNYAIPDSCELSIIEGVRERTFDFPIYLLRKPLANFSLTFQTNRSKDPIIWTGSQIMLLASFIQGAENKHKAFEEALAHYRKKRPTPVATFFLALIFIIKDFTLLKYFHLDDWIAISRWTIRHLFDFRRLQRYLASNHEVYDFLLVNTLKQNRRFSDYHQTVDS